MTYFNTLIVLTTLVAHFAHACPDSFSAQSVSLEPSRSPHEASVGNGARPEHGESEPTPIKPVKTPCEILKEKMQAARADETGEDNLYGGVGCHDGEVLICVYPEGFVEPGDDPHGSAIVSACISAHEHHHGEQAECDPDGTGVYPPDNDLKCDKSESEALDAEIDCYESQNCPSGTAGDDCRTLVDSFKNEACTQYESAKGTAHPSC